MSVLIVIPARYASNRFPGKPLAPLKGASGIEKSLLQRSWEVASAVRGVDQLVVATDDTRISEIAEGFGAEVVMTPPECENGTARCAAALHELSGDYDIVVNFQGDAPLTPPRFVEDLIGRLRVTPEMAVATPVLVCDGKSLAAFREDRRNDRVGATTAVFDRHWRALYFSKEVIPFTTEAYEPDAISPVWHHVGVYAYRTGALREYASLQPGPLEKLEGLEQLRFLENGLPILCVAVAAKGEEFWELNNPSDIARIEAILSARGAE